MSAYNASVRKQIRDALIANKVDRRRVDEIVDLACHAADSAETALMEVVKRAEDFGKGAMALELALQLARSRFDAIFERKREMGKTIGCPQYEAPIEVAL